MTLQVRREEELKAELDMATMRCAELKKTLKETLTHASHMARGAGGARRDRGPKDSNDDDDDAFDVDDLYVFFSMFFLPSLVCDGLFVSLIHLLLHVCIL